MNVVSVYLGRQNGGRGGGGGRQSKSGSGKWAGMEVYTAPSIQAHFRLAFDVHSLAMLIPREPSSQFASF